MRKQTTATLIWIGIFVVIGVAIYGLIKASGSSTTTNSTVKGLPAVTDADWSRGDKNAPVTLIEYGDFQCPACGSYFPVVEKLVNENQSKLRLVFREYPLTTVHKNGLVAAQAAEAAGNQGKFWEMYSKLYDNQNDWSDSNDAKTIFDGYAKDLGLDVTKFDTDYASDTVRKAIQSDVDGGNTAGVDGTPSFFVNGARITNPSSATVFQGIIDTAASNATVTNANTNADAKVHIHADFAMYVNATHIDLSAAKYQSTKDKELDPNVHVHDGNGKIIHVHAAGVTLDTFLQSLGMKITQDCLTTDDSVEHCADEGHILTLYVNGTAQTNPTGYVIKDLDKIVLTYGVASAATIKTQLESVSNDACLYSGTCPERGKAPTEDCVGGLGTDCTD